MIWIKNAKYLAGHTVRIWFSDGNVSDVDLKDSLRGKIFEPLKDPDEFAKVKYSGDLETIFWDSGADFAPEYLYDLAQKQRKQASTKPIASQG